MKLYRSLVYRELKLTRKHRILMMTVFLLLALIMLIPLMLGGYSEAAESEDSPVEMVLFFVGVVSLQAGFSAGTNNGLQKADISSGWKRYSYVLPTTAKQQALSDLLTKLCYVLLFGLLSAGFALIYTVMADYNAFGIMINVFLGSFCAVVLVDIAYSYIMMFAKDKKQLKVIGVIAFLFAGLILKFADMFIDFKSLSNGAEEGQLISDEAFNSLVTTISSGKTALCLFAAFAALCTVYFFAMWRSHERREQ